MADELIQPLAAAPPQADQMVQPAEVPPTTTEPAVAPESAPAQTAGLPEELLQVPAIQAVVAGAPPAVSGTIADFSKRPEGKLIAANKEPLKQAGMGFYRSLGGDLGVIFNRFYISDQEIQEADKAGTLSQIAPPFESVNTSTQQAGLNNPSFNHSGPPGGFKQAPVPTVPQASTTIPNEPPASLQRKAMAGKVMNAKPTGPLSAPAPGAGSLLRDILKPVV